MGDPSTRAGSREPVLVGEDDCLHSVSQIQFAHQVVKVRLDGGLAEEQGIGYFPVG